MAMPINRLRQVDIAELDEEELVAEILSARMAKLPPQRQIKLKIPDIQTPEEEAMWQKRIDRLQAKQKAKTAGKPFVDGEETKPLETEEVFHGPNGDVELAQEEETEDEQLDTQSSENDSSDAVISDKKVETGDEVDEEEEDDEESESPVLCVACGSKSRRHKKNCPTKLNSDANTTESPT